MTKARDLANASTALSAVSATELAFVDGVTSAIQTQMDAKAPSSTAVTLTGTQTLTNKTLTSPVISSVINNTLTSTTGDIIYASAANTPARLGIGSSAQVLSVSGGVPAWATPEAAGSMTLLSTTSMSGSSITISSISQSYKNLVIEFANVTATADYTYRWQPNGNDDSSNMNAVRTMNTTVATYAIGNGSNWMIDNNYNFLSSNTTNKVTLTIFDYASTTSYKNYTLYGSAQRSNTQWLSTKESGTFLSNTALSSIGIVSGQTFNGGTIKIYGVK